MTEDDVARLRGHGLSDAEIFDVVLTAAARCCFSKALDSMGAEPDPEYVEAAELLELVELTEAPP